MIRGRRALPPAMMLAALLCAFVAQEASAAAASKPSTATSGVAAPIIDDLGQRVTVGHAPPRIVSIAPGATEMLFAAGGGSRIVATVEFSDEPAAARRIPRIGDSNAIDMERLAALQPDVVVVWPGGNNPAQIEKIERLGIPLYRHRVLRLADLAPSVERLGRLAGTSEAAKSAAAAIRSRLHRLETTYGSRRPLDVLAQVWDRPIYTVGRTHLVADALRVCGGRNVFDDLADLSPAVDIESVIARDPEVIVAIALPGTAASWLDGWRKFPSLRAVRTDALIAFEDPSLTRLGPSALGGTEALCKELASTRERLDANAGPGLR